MRFKSWGKQAVSVLLIVALVLPGVVQAKSGTAAAQAGEETAAPGADTKQWALAAKEAMKTASKQTAQDPKKIPVATKENVMEQQWDSFQAAEVWELSQSLDRAALQVIAYFYPQWDRFLSHKEQVEKNGWNDEAVMERFGGLEKGQRDRLVASVPVVQTFVQQWETLQQEKTPESALPSMAVPSATAEVPDEMYDPKELTSQYRRSNTDNPVDERYRSANIKETDLQLDGKHGMNVTLERTYSSMDSAEDTAYYSSGGTNKVHSNFEYEEENHMPWGWKLNLPSFEEIGRRYSKCTYYPEQSRSGCGLYTSGMR